MANLRIIWKRSGIGHPEDQRRTMRALGFRRLNQTIVHEDTQSIRGMIHKVKHLIYIEEIT